MKTKAVLFSSSLLKLNSTPWQIVDVSSFSFFLRSLLYLIQFTRIRAKQDFYLLQHLQSRDNLSLIHSRSVTACLQAHKGGGETLFTAFFMLTWNKFSFCSKLSKLNLISDNNVNMVTPRAPHPFLFLRWIPASGACIYCLQWLRPIFLLSTAVEPCVSSAINHWQLRLLICFPFSVSPTLQISSSPAYPLLFTRNERKCLVFERLREAHCSRWEREDCLPSKTRYFLPASRSKGRRAGAAANYTSTAESPLNLRQRRDAAEEQAAVKVLRVSVSHAAKTDALVNNIYHGCQMLKRLLELIKSLGFTCFIN